MWQLPKLPYSTENEQIMFGLQYYYFMPLGFALICFALCVSFYRFLENFTSDWVSTQSPLNSIFDSRPLPNDNMRYTVIVLCKAAKQVKIVF